MSFSHKFWQEEIIKLIKYAEQSCGNASHLYVCYPLKLANIVCLIWITSLTAGKNTESVDAGAVDLLQVKYCSLA